MKGLILVGGLGTQLRPLTLSKAKPLIEFANKPHLLRLLELLKHAGVTEAVLAINYRPAIMADFLEEYAKSPDAIKITLSQEHEPLGTAGPLALAKDLLNDGEPFFVMNCDIACEFNLRMALDFHNAHGKVGTIMVTRVDEPAKYGKSVVVTQCAARRAHRLSARGDPCARACGRVRVRACAHAQTRRPRRMADSTLITPTRSSWTQVGTRRNGARRLG